MTSHMVSGTSDHQDRLLKQIESIDRVKKAWVVRSEGLSRQYGSGIYLQEPRDDIDRDRD
ncbi:MAG: hypothetical protein IE884_08275 [Sulfuricurvum sp.]|nr:hypothetical protein [Sulfuricurvum sp.]